MRTARTAQKSRREQVEGSLKELEIRSAKAKSPPLSMRIHQAGLTWSKQRFFIIGAIMGIVTFVLFLMINAGLLAAAGAGFAAAFGLPFWILHFLKKRREAKFLAGFPGCGRRHRARHQGRPAAARLPAHDHHRLAGAAEERIPRHRRDAGHRPAARRRLRQALSSAFRCRRRTSSASSSRSSRRPAAICRKRSATFPGSCATARR